MSKLNLGKWISGLCSAGVAVLGFGCDSESGAECMYGTPVGTYEIKGSVTDMDGNAVGNATIRVASPKNDSGLHSAGVSKTDAKGVYEVEGEFFPIKEMKVVCIPEQPTLEPDSVVVKMEYKGKDKGIPWNAGHAEETVDFKLKEKKGAE